MLSIIAIKHSWLYWKELIHLNIFKCFQVLLCNILTIQLNISHFTWLDISICPVDGTLTVTITLGQSGLRTNGN